MITGDPAGRRPEILGVLRIDAALDRVTAQFDVRLAITKRHAGRDAELLADNVDATDHFADRVLNLQARIHFDKKELAVLI